MGVIGGFIHHLGLVALASGVPSQLGFIPDLLTYGNFMEFSTALKTTNTNIRGAIPNASAGNWNDDINTDTDIYSSLVPKDGFLKYIEVDTNLNSGREVEIYCTKTEHTERSDTNVIILISTTGKFSDDTGDSLSEGDMLCYSWKRDGFTTGGITNGIGLWGFTWA